MELNDSVDSERARIMIQHDEIDDLCARCGEMTMPDDRAEVIATLADVEIPNLGPFQPGDGILVHASCMRDGEAVA